MHYIIGTSFTVDAKANRGLNSRYDTLLVPGQSFRIVHIQKTDTGITYHFVGSNGTKPIITFPSARVADGMIARYRKEQIPDYENMPPSESI